MKRFADYPIGFSFRIKATKTTCGLYNLMHVKQTKINHLVPWFANARHSGNCFKHEANTKMRAFSIGPAT